MDPELEARAEPQRAQNPQIVLLKPPVGITDGTDQLLLEILLALEGITPLVPDRMIGDGVDGKVAPRQVVHERHAELHHRVAAICLDILPKGRDLVRLIVRVEHSHGAVLDSHRHGAF